MPQLGVAPTDNFCQSEGAEVTWSHCCPHIGGTVWVIDRYQRVINLGWVSTVKSIVTFWDTCFSWNYNAVYILCSDSCNRYKYYLWIFLLLCTKKSFECCMKINLATFTTWFIPFYLLESYLETNLNDY